MLVCFVTRILVMVGNRRFCVKQVTIANGIASRRVLLWWRCLRFYHRQILCLLKILLSQSRTIDQGFARLLIAIGTWLYHCKSARNIRGSFPVPVVKSSPIYWQYSSEMMNYHSAKGFFPKYYKLERDKFINGASQSRRARHWITFQLWNSVTRVLLVDLSTPPLCDWAHVQKVYVREFTTYLGESVNNG